LIRDGHVVVAIARGQEQRGRLERVGATGVEADLFESDSLRRAVSGCDAVVNLATHMPASTTEMLRPSAWKENDRVRSLGSSNLVDAALAGGVGRFIQESFAPAYPDCGNRWIEEDTPLRPVRYNRTLLNAEESAARFRKSGGAGVVLRFASFYGPDSRFLAEGIRQVKHGRTFLPGAPEAFVSSVSHDDAATAVAAALRIPAGVYNVVDDEPLTRREYFHSLAGALGVPPPRPLAWWVKLLFGSLGELLSRSQRISNNKLKSTLSWTPKYRSVREGWPDTVAGLGSNAGSAAV
jgi:nucleoside-diphosphate-sugar epimerase